MKFVNVGSGSKGNASIVYSGDTIIQIDMGLPLNRIEPELDKLGKKIGDLQGLLITHDHGDHIKCVSLYHGQVPVYCGDGTYGGLYTPITPWVPFEIGCFNIVPFQTYHDAKNPICFVIEDEKERLCWITDTGKLDRNILKLIEDCDYYYIESNYEPKMLRESSRPEILKRRIASGHGHLSNLASSRYIASCVGPRTKGIYLAHISEECNTPEKALEAYRKKFAHDKIDLSKIELVCCNQWTPTYGGDK